MTTRKSLTITLPEHQILWLKSYVYCHNEQKSRVIERAMDDYILKTETEEEAREMKIEKWAEDAKIAEYERKLEEARDNEDEHMNWGRI